MAATNSGDGNSPRDIAGRIERSEGIIEARDSSIEDTPGAPSWPMPSTGVAEEAPTPPVGLNWAAVASQLGIDHRVLEHDGQIILTGEYFPEAGFFIDPQTFDARAVDVGEIALRSGYFLGDLSVSEFHIQMPVRREVPRPAGKPVIVPQAGSVIGLFTTQIEAERAKRKIMQSSLGSGIAVEHGPLGVELRVAHPEISGRVATIIASQGGAVVSVAGRGFGGVGAMATGSPQPGDARRAGTGSFSGSGGPEPSAMDATEVADGREFSSL